MPQNVIGKADNSLQKGKQTMKKHSVYTDYLLILIGAFVMGFAIKNLYTPINLVTGGVSGIAIIMKNVSGIPLWITNTICNIPLFLAAWNMKGWQFIKRTLFATAALSVSLYVLPEKAFLTDDLVLTALFGGIVCGAGTGFVFLSQATTGGTDMLAALLQKKMRHYSIAQIMQVLDGMIVILGAAIFGIRYALYALIAIYATAKVSDGLLEGLKFSKQAYVISDYYQEIAQAVMTRMERGVTALDAVGMYSGEGKKMLFCVVSKKEIVKLREIVAEFDKKAFLIVTDVREVFGEGFIEY